ncbi:hypothetical protein [Flavihumibacter petaseus]|uniref:Uncharacterized protein n=1 Tax=Flavihumibacter petaseus NBRC 106054 TaxID=1220578 RepID=A0A0E9N3P0_9BACT|nr:hypothetical protein [Flavihumibacter petaseus]GAO44429.1 hypothetical protein FPE01S_03_04670 [Flavihumibacter petaseus NBRC 106054]
MCSKLRILTPVSRADFLHALATARHEEDSQYIQSLKDYLLRRLYTAVAGVVFNGDATENSLHTVLNVGFPKTEKTAMLATQLDMKGICVSEVS